jgi:hypothetical protein
MAVIGRAPLRIEVPAALNPKSPVYFGRVAGVTDRALFEAELSAPPWNAGRVFDFQLVDALEASVQERLDPELAAPLLDVLMRLRHDPGSLTVNDRGVIAEMEEAESQRPGAYASLLAARRRRASLLPLLALRRFLTGWDRPEPFVLAHDGGPDEATLELIPETERLWLGSQLWARQKVQPDEGKPSPSPPPSPPAPATSKAGGGRKTAGRAGKSRAKSTR